MFSSARIKLTLWYLLIIAIITALFSVGIYKGFTREFDRIVRIQRFRIEHPDQFPPGRVFTEAPSGAPETRRFDAQLIEESENRIRATIALVDLGILAASALAGYFLAGRTLRPIEQMLEEQKRFTADASHELRTPLAALRTSIEVSLRDKNLNLKQAKAILQDNLEEVENLQALSDNLLVLTRAQDGRNGFNLQKVSLQKVVDEAIGKINVLARQNQIEVVSRVEEYVFDADEEKVVRLIVVLLDNALKYSGSGKKVYLLAKPLERKIKIEVKDDGLGIAEEDLPHIFDRFYRADKSRSKILGYGLGLPIAKKIAQLHKGVISVESKLGKGSVFTVLLPIG